MTGHPAICPRLPTTGKLVSHIFKVRFRHLIGPRSFVRGGFAGSGNIDLVLSQDTPLHNHHGLSACAICDHTAPCSGVICISVHRIIIAYYFVEPRFRGVQVWRNLSSRSRLRRTKTNVLPCTRHCCFFSDRIRSPITQNT